MKIKWSKKFPTKVGMYWFYGYRFKGEKDKEFTLVKVNKISKGFMYSAEGHFMFESETGEGTFCKVVLPELPKGV